MQLLGTYFGLLMLHGLTLNGITGEILDIGYDVCTCTGSANNTFDGKYHEAEADWGQTPLRG